MKTAYQIADNGPTARVPSRATGSRPNKGLIPISVVPPGPSANSASMMTSDRNPPR